MNAPAIITERLEQIKKLDKGEHADFAHGMCAMEAASYIAGEPWSDQPECVCPVIAAFLRTWNDDLPDDKRTELLLPLIPLTIGTHGSAELAKRRAIMAADWLVRVYAPTWLRLADLPEHADTLADLPEITSFFKVPVVTLVLKAAWGTNGGTAWTAARRSGGVAAHSASGGGGWNDVRNVAWDAALSATKEASVKVDPSPTIAELQASAAELVKRMCAEAAS